MLCVVGARCVLSLLWPIPTAALDKFYFHFYTSLDAGQQVASAVTAAMHQLKDDNRLVVCYSGLQQYPFKVEYHANENRLKILKKIAYVKQRYPIIKTKTKLTALDFFLNVIKFLGFYIKNSSF